MRRISTPRRALSRLRQKLVDHGVTFLDETSDGGHPISSPTAPARHASAKRRALRGVRGEMLYLQTKRRGAVAAGPGSFIPASHSTSCRGGGLFMCGATMIETDDGGPISARSLMELLNAAYALHPAFRRSAPLRDRRRRPPRLRQQPAARPCAPGRTITINGLYRHGFLLSPALAAEAADLALAQDLRRRCRMRLTVNGEDHDLAVTTLAELLAALDFEGDWLATRRQRRTGAPGRRVRVMRSATGTGSKFSRR